MRYFGRHVDTGLPVCVETGDGRIVAIEPVAATSLDGWPWIGPGLIDIQVNGYGGQEFNARDLSPSKVVGIGEQLLSCGVTRFCPTVTTQHFDVLAHAMRTLAAACESSPNFARQAAGIHLEGPYICADDGPRGAHPREHCRAPDWDEFQRLQEAAGGRIRILTMAVHHEGTAEFIRRVAESGVVVAVGHTAADSEQIRAAVDAGARLSTHLGNGAHGTLRRHPNYLWDQLAEDRLTASLIVDGHHLPPEVVKVFVRAKTPDRCILVSDMSGLAGLPPGRYPSNLCDVEILPNGRMIIAGQTQLLAGASLPLNVGVANAVTFAGIALGTALRMATVHPARLLGLDPATLEPGAPADLIQFEVCSPVGSQPARLNVGCTVVAGQVLFGGPWSPSL